MIGYAKITRDMTERQVAQQTLRETAQQFRSAAEAEAEFTVLRKPYQLSDLSQALAAATTEVRLHNATNVVRLRDARRAGAGEGSAHNKQRDPA